MILQVPPNAIPLYQSLLGDNDGWEALNKAGYLFWVVAFGE